MSFIQKLSKNTVHLSALKVISRNKVLLKNPVMTVVSSYPKNAQITRFFSHMTRNFYTGVLVGNKQSFSKSCSCSAHARKGDEELVAFLVDEIENERKAQLSDDLPKLEGFECVLDGAEVTLTKKLNNEIIKITSNVNNSVDTEDVVMDPNQDKEPQESEMKAKPEFTVEITKGKKTLSFLCNYNHSSAEDEADGEPYNDVFQISELSLHEGELEDSTYSVSGEIMDGYLYDLLMNYLEERGISNDFADKLILFFTSYEHKLYINLLQGMKSFIEK